jgi:very-short-patch-repair endonuclease
MIEITVPFNDEPAPRDALLHRSRRGVQPVEHIGIPVTPVERTLLDLAALLPSPTLEKAMSSAIRKGLATVDSIDVCIAQFGGRGVKGTRKLRRVLRIIERDKSGSPSEVDAAQLIRSAAIPAPVQQLKIALPIGSNAYPDFTWPDRMKIVEVDGFDFHSSPEQQEHDLDRQNALLDLGYEIRRFSARDVRRNPQAVIAEITRFISDI